MTNALIAKDLKAREQINIMAELLHKQACLQYVIAERFESTEKRLARVERDHAAQLCDLTKETEYKLPEVDRYGDRTFLTKGYVSRIKLCQSCKQNAMDSKELVISLCRTCAIPTTVNAST